MPFKILVMLTNNIILANSGHYTLRPLDSSLGPLQTMHVTLNILTV